MRRCVISKSKFLEESEVVSIHYTISPFTWNIFDEVVTDLIPWVWNSLPSNPVFSSFVSYPSKKKLFFARVLLPLSSFLHGNPKGSVVIQLITSGVIATDKTFTTPVALVLVRGMSERENSLTTSSLYSLILSKDPIHWCLVKISTTRGCWWILAVFVDSLLSKPPAIFP